MKKVLIVGSSHFVETESANIIKTIQDADVETFFGDEMDKSEFYSFINSVSLFGDPKVAFIRNLHLMKNISEFILSMESCNETHIILGADKNSVKTPVCR